MKEVKLEAMKSFLSEADKANGWEWKGHVALNVGIYRHYGHGTGWGQWGIGPKARDAWYPDFEHIVYLTRRNGSWQVERRGTEFGGALGRGRNPFMTDNFEKVAFTCAAVPK